MHCGAVLPPPAIRSKSASQADGRGSSRRLRRIRPNSSWVDKQKLTKILKQPLSTSLYLDHESMAFPSSPGFSWPNWRECWLIDLMLLCR
jgi:hypothetical protein